MMPKYAAADGDLSAVEMNAVQDDSPPILFIAVRGAK